MQLKDWINQSFGSYAEAADAFGCSVSHLRHLCKSKGPRLPGLVLAKRIVELSKGDVTLDDLYASVGTRNQDVAA